MKSAIARSPFLIRVIVIAQCVGVSLAARRSHGSPIWFARNSMNGGEIASPGSANTLLCHGSRVAHSRIPLSVSQVSPNLSLNPDASPAALRAVRRRAG